MVRVRVFIPPFRQNNYFCLFFFSGLKLSDGKKLIDEIVDSIWEALEFNMDSDAFVLLINKLFRDAWDRVETNFRVLDFYKIYEIFAN